MRVVLIVGGVIIPLLALPLRSFSTNEGEGTEAVQPRASHIAFNPLKWDESSHTLSLSLMEEGWPQWELRSHVLVNGQPPRTRWEEIRIQLAALRDYFSCCVWPTIL